MDNSVGNKFHLGKIRKSEIYTPGRTLAFNFAGLRAFEGKTNIKVKNRVQIFGLSSKAQRRVKLKKICKTCISFKGFKRF